jgi:hypothetical protein
MHVFRPLVDVLLLSCTHGFPSSEILAVINAESRGPWPHSSKEQIYSFSTLEQTCSLVVTTMSNTSRKLTKSGLNAVVGFELLKDHDAGVARSVGD